MLVDLTNMNITGKDTQLVMMLITVNKNGIPYDTKESPYHKSGIRINSGSDSRPEKKGNDRNC